MPTHNARAKALWATGDDVSAARLEVLDENGFTAINGDNGGIWAPLNRIDIGGLGLGARHRYDLIVVGANANTSYQIDAARLICLDATISADRVYTLSATNALEGDVIEIIALPAMAAARIVTVNDNLGAALTTIGSGLGDARAAKFVYLTAQWRLLAQEHRKNRIISLNNVGAGSSFSTTSTSTVDVTGLIVSVASTLVGDKVLYTAHLPCHMTAGIGQADLVITDGGGGQTLSHGFNTTSTFPPVLSVSGVYNVTTGGTVTLKWKIASDNVANTAAVTGNGYITATLVRP